MTSMTTTAAAPLTALRAAIYDRVSDDRRGDARSVGEQDEANRGAASAEAWTVVATYEDNDRSASRFATKDRTARPVGSTCSCCGSRAGGDRKLGGWADLLDACQDRGVLVHITSHHRTYDPRRPR